MNYKLITDEKSNHIETNANGAGSQCVRRKNIGRLSFRERYLSLRNVKGTGIAAMSVPFSRYSLLTFHFSLPKGPQSHAARGGDGRQEGRECGYYDLHRNLNDPLFHRPSRSSVRRHRHRRQCRN